MKTFFMTMSSHPLLAVLMVIVFAILAAIVLAPAMAQAGHNVRDAALKLTKALPNGAATIYSDSIDTGTGTTGSQLADVEFLLSAPALVVGDLANGDTMKYSILSDTVDPIDGSSTVLFADCITQTGAAGAGAAAATFRFKLPTTAARLVGFKAVNSGAGDASDKSATLEVLA
jgi:hypothetical protein